MNKNNIMYIYDGSLEGLLTIIYDSMKTKSIPLNILKEGFYKASLFETYEYINTDYLKSERIFKSIKYKISDQALYNVYNSFLSNKKDKEILILYYLINGFKYGKIIDDMRNLNCVNKIQTYSKMVRRESHRLKGFVRFKTMKGILYSSINPDNDILELLIPHFKERLSNECWVIEDVKRKKAVIYNKKEYKIFDTSKYEINNIKFDESEDNYQNLWKSFIKSVTITSRKNRRCQMNFMPKKYWKYMSETEIYKNE